MIKVLLFPTHPVKSNGSGIRIYNESLVELFRNDPMFNVQLYKKSPNLSHLGNYYNVRTLDDDLNEIKPDIVHINGYTSQIIRQVVRLAHKKGIKIVHTLHWHPFHTMRHSFLKKMYFNIYIKPSIKYIDRFVCINEEEKRFVSQYSSKTTLIHHWQRSYTSEKSNTRETKMILFIGAMNYPNKGFETLWQLPEGKYDIHVVARDSHPLRSDMIHHQDISSQELENLYKRSMLLVVPSKYEAFSYVSLEALSNGCPVVMSDRVRIADCLEGIQGYCVYRYGDNRDFVDKVASTIGMSVDVDKINERFSSDKAKESYSELYSSLIY